MNFNIIDIQPTQVTIELENEACFRLEESVEVAVRKITASPDTEKAAVGSAINDHFRAEPPNTAAAAAPADLKDGIKVVTDTNVITIDGLTQDTEYEIVVGSFVCEEQQPQDDMEAISHKRIRTPRELVLLDVRDFGAAGDGVRFDTAAVQAAIMACPADGTVYLKRGTYLCGPIFLKSDIRIWLDEGAMILGSIDRADYPVLPGMTYTSDEKDEYNLGTWEGNPLSCHASLITGIGVKNVSIYGRGTINGNSPGADWWVNPKVKRDAWRPRLIFLNNCEKVTIQGVKVCNSPSWTIHPYYCDGVRIIDVKIQNPDNSPNTDGIDPESCKNVEIIGTKISVGDDCIAVKSGKIYMARRHFARTENVVVRNCLLERGHGSVTMGSECAGGIRDVLVTKCIFDSTDRGLRIKSRRGRGARSVIENIVFDNIRMKDVRMPFTVNMFYFCDPDGHSDYCQCKDPLPVDEMTPKIRDITARNIRCEGVEVSLLAAYGLPEQKIESLTIENVTASYKPKEERRPEVPVMMDGLDPMSGVGIYARNVKKLILKDVSISGIEDIESDTRDVDEVERDV